MGKKKKIKKHMQVKKRTRTKDSNMNLIQKFKNIKNILVDSIEPTTDTTHVFRCACEAIIYKSELEYIKKCILEYPHIETGGQLFGFWTPQGRPVVLYAIGPGPRAGHHTAFFEQDIDYLDYVGNSVVKYFGLCHIGEWHSHHQLGLAQPSGHDASNIQNNVDKLQLNHFLLCIGNCNDREATLNPFIFYQGARQYIKVSWNEVLIDSPFRAVIDCALKNVLVHPRTHSIDNMRETFPQSTYTKQKNYNDGYWLNDKKNSLVLKNILDYVKDRNYGCNVEVKLDNTTKYVHLLVSSSGKKDHDICFGHEFPNLPPQIMRYNINWNQCETKELYKPSNWSFEGDIFTAFKNYYPHIL